MKKYIIILLVFIVFISGCNKIVGNRGVSDFVSVKQDNSTTLAPKHVPDIAVDKLIIKPAKFRILDNVTMITKIKNIGTGNCTSVDVFIDFDYGIIEWQKISYACHYMPGMPCFEPGQYFNLTSYHAYNKTGYFNVSIQANCAWPLEENLANNLKSKKIFVRE